VAGITVAGVLGLSPMSGAKARGLPAALGTHGGAAPGTDVLDVRADGTGGFPVPSGEDGPVPRPRTRIPTIGRTATAVRRWRAMPPLAAVAVALVLPAATASLSAPVGPPARFPAAAPRVAVVGDSLTVQATGALIERLEASGTRPTVIARPGQALAGDFVQAALAGLAATPAEPGDVVVVATAANDALARGRAGRAGGADAAGAAYRRAVAEVADRFADRCVVLVNARDRVDPLFEPVHAAALDADLDAEAARRPNVVVADWAAASAPLPTAWFATDQLHFGADPAGPATLPSAAAWAGVVGDAVGRCPAGPAASTA
jgi:hypothetical protein